MGATTSLLFYDNDANNKDKMMTGNMKVSCMYHALHNESRHIKIILH